MYDQLMSLNLANIKIICPDCRGESLRVVCTTCQGQGLVAYNTVVDELSLDKTGSVESLFAYG